MLTTVWHKHGHRNVSVSVHINNPRKGGLTVHGEGAGSRFDFELIGLSGDYGSLALDALNK